MWKRLLLSALAAVSLALSPAASLIAFADDEPPGDDATEPSFRPPAAVLRHVDAPAASPAPAAVAAPKPELVIFVGGYQTCACADHSFDALAKRFTEAGFETMTFGDDPAFVYDTYGHLDANGRNLRDEIRSLSSGYSAIHIVTHSMGGAVADRAFAAGLSSADGVATYVSLAAPHSGSDAARVASLVNDAGSKELLHRLGSLAGIETQSEAVDDLATARPLAPPAGVVRLDLRESTDVLVTGRDAADPGVPSRILNGTGDGHGAILTDPSAVDLTLRTAMSRRVPPDERSQRLVDAAKRESDRLGALVLAGLAVLAVLFVVARLSPRVRSFEDMLARALPRPRRAPCP